MNQSTTHTLGARAIDLFTRGHGLRIMVLLATLSMTRGCSDDIEVPFDPNDIEVPVDPNDNEMPVAPNDNEVPTDSFCGSIATACMDELPRLDHDSISFRPISR